MNEILGCWDSKPLHNFASHGADAFRVMAMMLKEADKRGLTAEELDKGYQEALGYRGKDFFDIPMYVTSFWC